MNRPPSPNILLPLTLKERAVLTFIAEYQQQNGQSPSYQEIRTHFGLASFNSVQRYLQQLQNKGYIFIPGGNLKRAITVLHTPHSLSASVSSPASVNTDGGVDTHNNPNPFSTQFKTEASPGNRPAAESLSLPFLGRVAAGRPLEAMEYNEFVDVPATMVRYPERTYALRVVGDSMIEDGICDGDVLLVQKQSTAHNGQTVVAMVNQQASGPQATVKKFYRHAEQIELRPANSTMQSFWYSPEQLSMQGIVIGLLRQF